MSTFLDNLKKYLPVIEMGINVGLLASGVGAPFEPLAAGIENALNPLLNNLGTQQPVANTILALYAAIIGTLTTLKAVPGLPADKITEINGYLTAAQAATAAYYQSLQGFDPNNYKPVTPIV